MRQGFSGKTGSLQTHCLPKTGPELLNLLVQPPWCWGHVCEPIPPCLCGAEAGALVSACEASTPAAELRITLSVIFPVDHTQRYSEQLPVRSEWTCSQCSCGCGVRGPALVHFPLLISSSLFASWQGHPPGTLRGNWRCLRSLLIGSIWDTRFWLVYRKYHLGWISLGTWVPQRTFLLTLCFPNIPALCASLISPSLLGQLFEGSELWGVLFVPSVVLPLALLDASPASHCPVDLAQYILPSWMLAFYILLTSKTV